MTKKQMGLIFTLMALLVCVAVLSLKLNETGANDPSGLPALITNDEDEIVNTDEADKNKEKDKDKETAATQTTFISLRSSSENDYAEAIQNLQSIINSSNSSKEQMERATEEIALKNKIMDQQRRIETNIKLLGYSDALCLIDGGKAKVYIKSSEKLDEAKAAAINEVVEDVAQDVTTTTIKIEK